MSNAMILISDLTKNNVLASLDIMWKGLLAIFIVIGIIAVVTFIMNDMSANHLEGGGIVNRIKAYLRKRREKKASHPENDAERQ